MAKLNETQQNELKTALTPFIEANKYNGKSLRFFSQKQKHFLRGRLDKAVRICADSPNYRKDLESAHDIVHDFFLPMYNAKVAVVINDQNWRVWVAGLEYGTEPAI